MRRRLPTPLRAGGGRAPAGVLLRLPPLPPLPLLPLLPLLLLLLLSSRVPAARAQALPAPQPASLGAVTTLAGGGSTGVAAGAANGVGSNALFTNPLGIAFSNASRGSVAVTDGSGSAVRVITVATRAVVTLAGGSCAPSAAYGVGGASNGCTAATSGAVSCCPLTANFADGPGVAARFNVPWGLGSLPNGNYLVSDTCNHAIREVAWTTGAVTTLAGTPKTCGRADGIGTAARFRFPQDARVNDGEVIFIADSGNNLIRKLVHSTRVVTTLAGGGGSVGTAAGFAGLQDGVGTNARFNAVTGIATDGPHVFVADSFNNRVRKIVAATAVVTTLAGGGSAAGTAWGYADGTGTAALFNLAQVFTNGMGGDISKVDVDDRGNLYLADSMNNMIRAIVTATGVVSTLAGATAAGAANGLGTAARFNGPMGIAVNESGVVYITDYFNNLVRAAAVVYATPTRTVTGTASRTVTATTSATASRPSASATVTRSRSATGTATASPTAAVTASPTAATTPSRSATATVTASGSGTAASTPSGSAAVTASSTVGASSSQTATRSASGSQPRTASVTAAGTPAATSSGTAAATASVSGTPTAAVTASGSAAVTASQTAAVTASPSSTASATPSDSLTASASGTPTATATSASATATAAATATSSATAPPSASLSRGTSASTTPSAAATSSTSATESSGGVIVLVSASSTAAAAGSAAASSSGVADASPSSSGSSGGDGDDGGSPSLTPSASAANATNSSVLIGGGGGGSSGADAAVAATAGSAALIAGGAGALAALAVLAAALLLLARRRRRRLRVGAKPPMEDGSAASSTPAALQRRLSAHTADGAVVAANPMMVVAAAATPAAHGGLTAAVAGSAASPARLSGRRAAAVTTADASGDGDLSARDSPSARIFVGSGRRIGVGGTGVATANPLHAAVAAASVPGVSAAAVAPLPPGWEESWSDEHGAPFWHETATGVSTWERPQAPAPLLPGWHEAFSQRTQAPYWWHDDGSKSWTRPAEVVAIPERQSRRAQSADAMAPLLTPLPPAAAAVRVGAGHIKTSRTVASTIMLRRVEEVKGDREWARSQVGTKSFTMKSTQTVLEASERLKAVAAIAIIATRFRAKLQARIARHAAAAAEGAAV